MVKLREGTIITLLRKDRRFIVLSISFLVVFFVEVGFVGANWVNEWGTQDVTISGLGLNKVQIANGNCFFVRIHETTWYYNGNPIHETDYALEKYNVLAPPRVSQTSWVYFDENSVEDFHVDGNIAGVIQNDRLWFLNVTNMQKIGDYCYFRCSLSDPQYVFLKSQVAYVLDTGVGGLVLVNLTDPLNPNTYGTIPINGTYKSLLVHQNTAYINNGTLVAVDVIQPSTPKLIGTLYSSGINLFAIANNIGILCGNDTLVLLDLNDPYAPTVLAEKTIPFGVSRDIAVDGNKTFVLNTEGEIFQIDIQNATNLEVERSWDVPGSYAIQVEGDALFILKTGSLFLIQLSNNRLGNDLLTLLGLTALIGLCAIGGYVWWWYRRGMKDHISTRKTFLLQSLEVTEMNIKNRDKDLVEIESKLPIIDSIIGEVNQIAWLTGVKIEQELATRVKNLNETLLRARFKQVKQEIGRCYEQDLFQAATKTLESGNQIIKKLQELQISAYEEARYIEEWREKIKTQRATVEESLILRLAEVNDFINRREVIKARMILTEIQRIAAREQYSDLNNRVVEYTNRLDSLAIFVELLNKTPHLDISTLCTTFNKTRKEIFLLLSDWGTLIDLDVHQDYVEPKGDALSTEIKALQEQFNQWGSNENKTANKKV